MIKMGEGLHWRRSRRCSHGACVEVARIEDGYLVRDSKNPGGAYLAFTDQEWEAFMDGVKAGDFGF